MSDEALLLAAILAQPEEDTPRLVYADWLDENGQPERAEFTRVQVRVGEIQRTVKGAGAETDLQPFAREVSRLSKRAKSLFRSEWVLPARDLLRASAGMYGGRLWFGESNKNLDVSRGFVECVTCTAADWLDENGDAVRAAHPVTKVVLTTLPEVEFLGDDARSDRETARLAGRGWRAISRLGGPARLLLEAEWPGIVFELPSIQPVEMV